MEVGDGFTSVAAIIDHQAIACLGDAELFRDLAGGDQHPAQQRRVGILRCGNPRDNPLRYDEHVRGRLGIHVLDGKKLLRLVDDLGGDLARRRFSRRWSCGGSGEREVHLIRASCKGSLFANKGNDLRAKAVAVAAPNLPPAQEFHCGFQV